LLSCAAGGLEKLVAPDVRDVLLAAAVVLLALEPVAALLDLLDVASGFPVLEAEAEELVPVDALPAGFDEE
jgi:hypothetical protein